MDTLLTSTVRNSPSLNSFSNLPGMENNIKCANLPEVCEGCRTKVQDRYLMRVGDAIWHERCLVCSICGERLMKSCYFKNNSIYCKSDYDRLFSIKCFRCGDRVMPQELIMRVQSFIYHLSCFTCVICCQLLQKGEQFVLKSGQLYCRLDHEKEKFIFHHQSTVGNMVLDESGKPRDGRRGPKRPRTILTSIQRRQFKASFELSPKPCRKVREALAKDTGLSVRVVQVWFQNQRAKMKKMQRKAKQDTEKNGEKMDKTEDDTKEDLNDSEKRRYLNTGNNYENTFSNGNLHDPSSLYSPDGTYIEHSGDSFCSSDISLDGSINMDETAGSDTLSLDLNISSSSHDMLSSSRQAQLSSQLNPIDKLYHMQNSYFNTIEQCNA